MKKFLLILAFSPLFVVRAQTCDSATWHYVEGVKAFHIRGDRDAAAASFERALTFDPEHMGALAAAASLGSDKALDYARRAFENDTTDIYLRRQLTRLLLDGRRLTEAVELSPDDINVLFAQADHFYNSNDETRFLDIVERLIRRSEINGPGLFESLANDRAFYVRNFPKMMGMARQLMLDAPTDYRAVKLYTGALLAGGRTEEGLEVYKSYITDTTSFSEPYVMIIDGEAYLQRPDSVHLWGARAITRFPDDYALRLQYGAALERLELNKEAHEIYDLVLRRATDDSIRSVACTLSGNLYARQGRARRSVADYSRAIDFDPDNAMALNNLAYTFAVQGRNLGRALEMSEKSLAIEPLNATYIDTYGYILYRLGNLEEAKKALRHAASLEDSPAILLHYADVLQALGEEFMAEHYRKKAAEMKR